MVERVYIPRSLRFEAEEIWKTQASTERVQLVSVFDVWGKPGVYLSVCNEKDPIPEDAIIFAGVEEDVNKFFGPGG